MKKPRPPLRRKIQLRRRERARERRRDSRFHKSMARLFQACDNQGFKLRQLLAEAIASRKERR